MPLEYDHLYPEALGGPTERENLWLACTRCNDWREPIKPHLADETNAEDRPTGSLEQ